jgi:hypothetical protein
MQPFLEIIAHELIKLYWYGTDVTLPSSLGGERVNVITFDRNRVGVIAFIKTEKNPKKAIF